MVDIIRKATSIVSILKSNIFILVIVQGVFFSCNHKFNTQKNMCGFWGIYEDSSYVERSVDFDFVGNTLYIDNNGVTLSRNDSYTIMNNIDSISISSIGIETIVEWNISKNDLIDECIHDGYARHIIKDCGSVFTICSIIRNASYSNRKSNGNNYTVVMVLYGAEQYDTIWVGIHQFECKNKFYETSIELIDFINSIDNKQMPQIETVPFDF